MGKLDELNALGINTTVGLEYTGMDEDFYIEMLHDYIDVKDERVGDLCSLYDAENWPDYRTGAHSLKSVSRMVGIEDFAEDAYALEKACDAGDIAFVKANHDEFIKKYTELVDKISAIIG